MSDLEFYYTVSYNLWWQEALRYMTISLKPFGNACLSLVSTGFDHECVKNTGWNPVAHLHTNDNVSSAGKPPLIQVLHLGSQGACNCSSLCMSHMHPVTVLNLCQFATDDDIIPAAQAELCNRISAFVFELTPGYPYLQDITYWHLKMCKSISSLSLMLCYAILESICQKRRTCHFPEEMPAFWSSALHSSASSWIHLSYCKNFKYYYSFRGKNIWSHSN